MTKRFIWLVALAILFLVHGTAQAEPPPVQKKLPRVVILATGGTIAGTGASSTQTAGYKAATVGVEQMIIAVPQLRNIAQIKAEQVSQIASENMNDEIWLKLAKRINELLRRYDVDGIVVTHGTDTLEETAYFLNLVVRSTKPVVVIGAMRPSTAISADGPMNLYNAVLVAGSEDAMEKGVLITMNDQILGAREATKMSTYGLDAFRAPELGFIGYVHNGEISFYRTPARRHTIHSEFDVTSAKSLPHVDIVYGYAGSARVPIDAFVAANTQGIVHAGTGNGSLSDNAKAGLIDARKKGVLIVRSSRTGSGPVARNGEANDDALDFISSDSLNPQKARVLLMLALTRTRDSKKIQKMFFEY